MLLLKNRISKIRPVAHSLYVDDADFLRGSNIDTKLTLLEEASKDSYLYKVTTPTGVLVGFFTAPKDGSKKVSGFYISKLIREEKAYIENFWQLVSQTVFGKVYESLSSINIQDFNSLLELQVTINEPGKFFGLNYNLNY